MNARGLFFFQPRTTMNQLFCQLLLACLLAAALPQLAWAEAASVSAALVWPTARARPGEALPLAVVMEISEGVHINADAKQIRPSGSFRPYPTKLTVVNADQGLHSEAPLYPSAQRFKTSYAQGGLMSFSGTTVIYLPITFAAELALGAEPGLELELAYQACTESQCLLPQTIRLKTKLPLAAPGEAVPLTHQKLFADYQARRQQAAAGSGVHFALFGWKFSVNGASWPGVLLLLATAAFGGMLLNCTPCVLPLIPIKIISLSYAAKNRRRCFLLGAAMSLGVLAFWLVLGGMIALVSGFSSTNQLFQYPAFTVAVGLIIGIMALGMFDFFSLPLPEWLYLIHPEQDSLHGSFGLGILAAVLSTPCTAPFMGAAAAWAAAQPPAATLSVFAAIGSGMAFPYLALSAAPHLVRRMPRTGPASLLIKQVMGLLMLAAAAYFIGVGAATLLATAEQPPSRLYWWPVMGCSLAAGGWLAWRTWRIASGQVLKVVFMSIGGLIMAVSVYGAVNLTERGLTAWQHYSPAGFAQARTAGKAMLLVFTAEWCLNCKVLEQGVLDSPKIVKLLGQEGLVPMKVDITGSNPPGRELLRQVGSLSIPLLVIYSRSGELSYKSDFYTADELQEAVSRALN